ncbi:phage tail assembly chaperone [Pseudomonas sp. PAB10]|uniref:phage tail assembly chaperone n=1 Tax=Pseudomonas sp. PAB10 TaxID=3233047 RepID=UPI003F95EBB2
MSLHYSATTGGFYDTGIHKIMPADIVEITAKERTDLLAGERQSRVIVADGNGRPVLIDPVEDPGARITQERAWRDAELQSIQWLRDRHRDELELSVKASLSAEQYAELLTYLQLLRDWPASPDFPDSVHRPSKPDWIAQQAQ